MNASLLAPDVELKLSSLQLIQRSRALYSSTALQLYSAIHSTSSTPSLRMTEHEQGRNRAKRKLDSPCVSFLSGFWSSRVSDRTRHAPRALVAHTTARLSKDQARKYTTKRNQSVSALLQGCVAHLVSELPGHLEQLRHATQLRRARGCAQHRKESSAKPQGRAL